jgi:hypothetical protein
VPRHGRPAAIDVRRAIGVAIAVAAALSIKHELRLSGVVTTAVGLPLIVLAIVVADNVRPPPDNR